MPHHDRFQIYQLPFRRQGGKLPELADKLLDYCEPRKINLSLPSLRADNFSRELMLKVLLLLIAAMVSNNGIGGGDIKLAALLGILYGPYGVLFILAAASLSALAFQALERFFYYRKWNTLPFAPFLFLGSIIAVSLQCRF